MRIQGLVKRNSVSAATPATWQRLSVCDCVEMDVGRHRSQDDSTRLRAAKLRRCLRHEGQDQRRHVRSMCCYLSRCEQEKGLMMHALQITILLTQQTARFPDKSFNNTFPVC